MSSTSKCSQGVTSGAERLNYYRCCTHLIPPALCLQQPEPEGSPVLVLQHQVEPLDPLGAAVGVPLYQQLLRAPVVRRCTQHNRTRMKRISAHNYQARRPKLSSRLQTTPHTHTPVILQHCARPPSKGAVRAVEARQCLQACGGCSFCCAFSSCCCILQPLLDVHLLHLRAVKIFQRQRGGCAGANLRCSGPHTADSAPLLR